VSAHGGRRALCAEGCQPMVGGGYYAKRGVYPGGEVYYAQRGVIPQGVPKGVPRDIPQGVPTGVPKGIPRVYYTHHGIPYPTLVYTTLPYPGYTTLPCTTGYTASPWTGCGVLEPWAQGGGSPWVRGPNPS